MSSSKDCGICPEIISKALPCGHETSDRCGIDATKIECVEPCEILLKCGHKCTQICGKPCNYICKSIVEAELLCGHLAKKECYKNVNDVKCSTKVGRLAILQYLGDLGALLFVYLSHLRFKSSGLSVAILLKLNAIQMLNRFYARINVSPLVLIVGISAKERVENAEMVQF